MLTETEARAKWCPMARQSFEGSGTYNRSDEGRGSRSCRCLASECMAWQWDSEPAPLCGRGTAYAASVHDPRPEHIPDSWVVENDEEQGPRWREPVAEYEARREFVLARWQEARRGFCGLAR